MMNQPELFSLLADQQKLIRLDDMTRQQLDALLGPDFAAMKDYDQRNPHHHLDLLLHTLAVLTALGGDAPLLLKLAALLHDIGKPACAMEKQGRTVYYGHAERSAEITRALLKAIGLSKADIQRVCFWVRYHDTFINFKLPWELDGHANPHLKPITPETVLCRLDDIRQQEAQAGRPLPSHADLSLLLRLALADVSAQAVHAPGYGSSERRSRKQWRILSITQCWEDALQK